MTTPTPVIESDPKCEKHTESQSSVFWCADCGGYRCEDCEEAQTCNHAASLSDFEGCDVHGTGIDEHCGCVPDPKS